MHTTETDLALRLARLESDNDALRARIAGLEQAVEPPAPDADDAEITRRRLLRKLGAAVAAGGAVAMGKTVLSPGVAGATHDPNDIGVHLGYNPTTGFSTATYQVQLDNQSTNGPTLLVTAKTPGPGVDNAPGAVRGVNTDLGAGISGYSTNGSGVRGNSGGGNGMAGVFGQSTTTDGVHGEANNTGRSGVFGDNLGGGWGVVGRTSSADKPAVWGDQLWNGSGSGAAGVLGTSKKFQGVAGVSDADDGVVGVSKASGNGVAGFSTSGDGVFGSGARNGMEGVTSNAGGSGVYGHNDGGGYGVAGRTGSGTLPGVLGDNTAGGPGVLATSLTGIGLKATTNGGRAIEALSQGANAVYGVSTSSDGIFGEVPAGNNLAGVHGKTAGGYAGMWAESVGTGVALRAQGGRAQLLLVPGATAGAPTTGTHVRGEVFCDSAGVVWLCVGGAPPGTFVRNLTSADGSAFVPVTPFRLLDTRDSSGPPIGAGAANERVLQVAGVSGIPATATALVFNLTVVSPTANNSWLTIYPDGVARPFVANVNFNAGQIVGNLATVKLGGGKVRIYNQAGTVHAVIDVAGYYT
jgi:hypothetical protein